MANTLIILGMHRSGTSITTQWLQECGLNIGTDLLGPQFSNKSGHFEDMDFYNLHESIFKESDMSFGGLQNIDKLFLSDQKRNELEDLLKRKSNQNKDWGWKDPRTCLLVDTYLSLLPEASILITSRKYDEIINSLIRRETKHIEEDILRDGNWGYLSFIRYENKEGKKLKRQLGEAFAQATIIYYTQLLGVIKKVTKNKLVCIKFRDLEKKEDQLFEIITDMGFQLKHFPLKNIYESSYLTSSKGCPYIPSDLRSQLDVLQKELESYCI